MPRKRELKPTPAELEILHVLWDQSQATVRQIHDELKKQRELGYTTVLKTLQLMLEKGLVRRRSPRRPHVYEPTRERDDVERSLVRDLVDRGFRGSATRLVMHALSERPESEADLAEIDRLVREAKRQRKKKRS